MTRADFYALEAFTRERLGAEHYPEDEHRLTRLTCERCGEQPYEIYITFHAESQPYDFHGILYGRCAVCGEWQVLFSVTGEAPRTVRRESPVCVCGGKRFYLAMLERYEGANGFAGWFDAGVIAGQCATCGQHLELLRTD